MNNYTSETNYLLTDIFTDYASFKEVVTSMVTNIDEAFCMWSYHIIMARFGQYSINYDTPQAFVQAFALVYYNRYAKTLKQRELITKVIEISADELLIVNQALTNYAENPNTNVANPLNPLEYITNQSFSTAKHSKLRAYMEALNAIPAEITHEYLFECTSEYDMCFNDLFTQIYVANYYVY